MKEPLARPSLISLVFRYRYIQPESETEKSASSSQSPV